MGIPLLQIDCILQSQLSQFYTTVAIMSHSHSKNLKSAANDFWTAHKLVIK